MSNFPKNMNILETRRDLYCVWIRSHEGPNAPLVSIWIDPEMRVFETNVTEIPRDPSIAPMFASGLDAWNAEDDDPPALIHAALQL
jgi:hypothetical protein